MGTTMTAERENDDTIPGVTPYNTALFVLSTLGTLAATFGLAQIRDDPDPAFSVARFTGLAVAAVVLFGAAFFAGPRTSMAAAILFAALAALCVAGTVYVAVRDGPTPGKAVIGVALAAFFVHGARLNARQRRTRLAADREASRRCPACGYDLRATPQGGRCPECGAVPPSSSAAGDAETPRR